MSIYIYIHIYIFLLLKNILSKPILKTPLNILGIMQRHGLLDANVRHLASELHVPAI